MSRSIVVFAVVFSAVVCLMGVGGAQQPTEPGTRYRVTKASPIASPQNVPTTPPVDPLGHASPTDAPPPNNPLVAAPTGRYAGAYGTPVPANAVSHDASQSLRQQYLELAEQHAGRMTDDELKQGIADMRRRFLIAQLKAFAESSPDSFDGTRVEIAIVALKAKDMQDIQTLVDSLPGRLEDTLRSRTRTELKH